MSNLFEEGEGPVNVTAGVADRQVPLAPESKQKRYSDKEMNLSVEESIDKTIQESAKKHIERLLVESTESFRTGMHVTVGNRKGQITSKSGPRKEKDTGRILEPEKYVVTFEDGSTQHVTANQMKYESGTGDHFSSRANAHFERAKINRRWHGSAAYNAELSKGHAEMAKFHKFNGDIEKEKESLELSAHHAKLADGIDKHNAAHPVPRVESSGIKYNPSFRQSYPKNQPKQDPTFKHYYNVPFAEKDKAKAKGLKWDSQAKKWYKGTWSETPTKTDWPVSHTVDLRKK